MKRLFTIAIIAMIASLTFAQAPKAVQKAKASNKIEKLANLDALNKQAKETKAIEAVKAEKAAAGQTTATSVLRRGAKTGVSSTVLGGKAMPNVKLNAAKSVSGLAAGPMRATAQEGNVTVTTDENGIITDVTGVEAKYYTRQGTAYYVSGQSMYYGDQSGVVAIIEDGNNVYIQKPVSRYTENSWVKGTKDGNTVTIPAKQPLAYNANYEATISLRWGVVTPTGNIAAADDHADAFTFTVDGNVWTLQGTKAFADADGEDTYFMGVFWDDDDSATGYGDAETVWTYDDSYVPPSSELVVLPDDATPEDWYMNAMAISSSGESKVKNRNVKVAFVGNDIYLSGFSTNFPESWVKGTVNGTSVEFDNFQYIGNYAGAYDIWFVGYDESANALIVPTAVYDSQEKSLTFNCSIVANAADDRLYYLEWYDGVVVSAEALVIEEPVITDLTTDVPYRNEFETDEELDEAAIYDANEDGSTFEFVMDGENGVARYRYNSQNPADDYIVFPGMQLEEGQAYKISVDAKAYSGTFPERLEVVAGTVAKASQLTIPVIVPTDLTSNVYETLKNNEFKVPASGVYYFALHAISDADEFYLYVDNFTVAPNDPAAPKPVDDITITADPSGANKATVEFTVPSVSEGGDNLTADLTVVVKRGADEVYNETKAPGAKVSFVDEVPEAAAYKYSVYTTYDGHTSEASAVSAFVGEDVPGAVENIQVADKTTSIDMTWEAPTEGENGGVVVESNLKYNVYPVVMEEFFGMLFPTTDFDNPYATGLTEPKATVEFDTMTGEMGYSYVAVSAENEFGEGIDSYGAVVAGTPYDMPVVESVAGAAPATWLGYSGDVAAIDEGAGVYIAEKSYDDDGYSIELYSPVEGWLDLTMGKVNPANAANPVVTFACSGAGTGATLDVNVVSAQGTKVLKTITPGENFEPQTLSLVEYAAEPWIRVTFKANFTADASIFIDKIKIYNQLDKNLVATKIAAPAKVKAGENATVEVTVENQGSQAVAAADYTVELYRNGEVVEVKDGVDMASDEIKTFDFVVATNVMSPAEMTFKAVVVYEADEDQNNNTTGEATTKLVISNFPTPTDLEGKSADGGIELKWAEPVIEGGAAEEVTEDFEDAAGFTAEYGDWTFVDVDGKPVGGPQGGLPGFTNGVTTGSFWIWDSEMVPDYADSFVPHSGNKCLFAMYNYDASKQSDWAISPELDGAAQTISFFANTPYANYGLEKFEVYYSTGSVNPDDFVKVAGPVEAPADWTEFSYDLPAGAKRFAIVCVSQDIYIFFVDDVTFTPASESAGLELAGYNVYRNAEKINDALVQDTEYVDANVVTGEEYTYAVSAVYAERGESAVSNNVTVTYGSDAINSIANGKLSVYTGKQTIAVVNASGLALTISAADGAVVFNGKATANTTVNVAPGVYVVKVGKETKKVVVK